MGKVKKKDDFRAALERLKAEHEGTGPRMQEGLDTTEIEKALQRLDSGHYGHCSCCHIAIPRRELLMRPWADQCQRCRERHAGAA